MKGRLVTPGPLTRRLPVLLLPLLGLTACTPDSETVDTDVHAEDDELAIVREWATDEGPAPSSAMTAEPANVPPVEDMIAGLESRLASNPSDVEGWSLLAQSYAYVGRMGDAREAVDRAVQLGAERAALEERVRRAHVGTE